MVLRFLLSPWIFYFLAILGLILAVVLIMKGKKRLITAKVLESSKDNIDFVYDLMCAEFPSACILKEASVSSAGAGNVQITQTLDILYISRGGVIIISVISGDGAYDNPKTGVWRHRYLGNNGKTVTVSLSNPFDSTIPAANILEGLLVGEKIYVDVQRAVVFTGSKIGLTANYPEVMSVDALIPYLHSVNQKNTMNGPQFRAASEVITALARYNQHKTLSAKHSQSYGENVAESVETDESLETTSAINEDAVEETITPVTTPTQLILPSDDESSDENETLQLLKKIQNELEKEEPTEETE